MRSSRMTNDQSSSRYRHSSVSSPRISRKVYRTIPRAQFVPTHRRDYLPERGNNHAQFYDSWRPFGGGWAASPTSARSLGKIQGVGAQRRRNSKTFGLRFWAV